MRTKDSHTQTISEYAIQVNREVWEAWAQLHPHTPSYDMQRFRDTKNSLTDIELELLGDIRGKKILHLQCHFGQDTLSLANLGAEVTGVDISENAIRFATNLSQELGIQANFVVSDVLKLNLAEKFDIVFTSYGVMCWLPDLKQWADVIAKHLVPGGQFIMVEFHPFLYVTNDELTQFDSTRPYSTGGKPIVINNIGSYAAPSDIVYTTHEFNHSLSDVFEALRIAHISNVKFKEYSYSSYGCFPGLVEEIPGSGQFTHAVYPGPLMFSIDAIFRPQYANELRIDELQRENEMLRAELKIKR